MCWIVDCSCTCLYPGFDLKILYEKGVSTICIGILAVQAVLAIGIDRKQAAFGNFYQVKGNVKINVGYVLNSVQ